MKEPFVTDKVGAGHMIMRGGDNHDAEYLTPEGKWTHDILEAASFPTRWRANKELEAMTT